MAYRAPVRKPGDINRNNQVLLRLTREPGSDHKSRIWILKCSLCVRVYGSNNADAWQRRCPKCQNGKQGLAVPTERNGEDWTREEHILAFDLYNKIEFGKFDEGNPDVIELAAILGRTTGSVSYKLGNFARLDPFHAARGIRGFTHGAKGEEAIWQEFAEHPEELILESTRLRADRLGVGVEQIAEIRQSDLPPEGKEREALVRLRVNQSFFRDRVLSAYKFRCCVTGLSNRSLLTASHIVPWAKDIRNRLNPRNGLCLNPFHDRAFDRGLMWIERNFVIRFSPKLVHAHVSTFGLDWFLSFEGKKLLLPSEFQPDPDLLAEHALVAKQRSST